MSKKEKLKVKRIPGCSSRRKLVYVNGASPGEVVREVDGYWYYVNTTQQGYFSSYNLRLIADALDNLNEEWDKKVQELVNKIEF